MEEFTVHMYCHGGEINSLKVQRCFAVIISCRYHEKISSLPMPETELSSVPSSASSSDALAPAKTTSPSLRVSYYQKKRGNIKLV